MSQKKAALPDSLPTYRKTSSRAIRAAVGIPSNMRGNSDSYVVLKPLKKAVRVIEHTVHLDEAIGSLVADGMQLLHVIEETEHEKVAIQSGLRKRRHVRRRP